jgi:hypothetical protein
MAMLGNSNLCFNFRACQEMTKKNLGPWSETVKLRLSFKESSAYGKCPVTVSQSVQVVRI